MPTYEYRCKRCKHQFDKSQPITANPLRTCPECGKKTLERVIGLGGGILVPGSIGGDGERADRGDARAGAGSTDAKTAAAGASSSKTAASGAPASGAGAAGSKDSGKGASKGATTETSRKDASTGASKKDGAGDGAGSGAGTGTKTDGGDSGGDPDRDAWKSKATHHSREGRGIGNLGSILKGAPTKGPRSGPPGGGGRGPTPGRGVPRRRSP